MQWLRIALEIFKLMLIMWGITILIVQVIGLVVKKENDNIIAVIRHGFLLIAVLLTFIMLNL